MAWYRCGGTPSEVLSLPTPSEASGAIARFNTDLTENLLSAVAEFSASQAEGTPTPSTPIPIVGVSAIQITDCGKNLLDEVSFRDYSNWKSDLNSNPTVPTGNTNRGFKLDLKSGVNYTLSFGITAESFPNYLYLCKDDGTTSTSLAMFSSTSYNTNKFTFTADDSLYYIRIANSNTEEGFNSQMSKISFAQLEFGSTATEHESYNGTTALINLGGTYYGGEVDAVTGKITLDHGLNTFDGTEANWSATDTHIFRLVTTGRNWLPVNSANWQLGYLSNILRTDVRATGATSDKLPDHSFYITSQYLYVRCDEYELADFKTALGSTNLQIVAPVSTPETEYASNTAEIPTIVGDNQVYADSGNIAVKFFETVGHKI